MTCISYYDQGLEALAYACPQELSHENYHVDYKMEQLSNYWVPNSSFESDQSKITGYL